MVFQKSILISLISTITKMSKMTIIITLKLKTSAMKRTTRKIIKEIMSSIKNITLLSAYPKVLLL